MYLGDVRGGERVSQLRPTAHCWGVGRVRVRVRVRVWVRIRVRARIRGRDR